MHINYDGNTFYINPFVTSGAGPRAVGTERGRWSNWQCNEVDRYGKKAAGNRRTFNNFNNKINNTNEKWQPLTEDCRTQNTNQNSRPGPLSSSTVVTPHLTLRSSSVGLETGEWCRCCSLPITPPASLRSHGSRPRPTRHTLDVQQNLT